MSHFWFRNRPSDLLTSIFVMILAGGILVSCTTTEPVSELPVPEESPPPVEPTPEQAEPPEPIGPQRDDEGVWTGHDGQPLSRVFLFDFDKALLSPSELSELEQWASFLREEGGTIVIEGHCDERGTREYNLALGERRSHTVRSFLVSTGVRDAQIDTVSYGEERPTDVGHDEAAWKQNRRAVIIYR